VHHSEETWQVTERVLADAQSEFERRVLRFAGGWRRLATLTPVDAIHIAFTGTRREPKRTLLYRHAVRAFALAAVGRVSDDPVSDIKQWCRERGRPVQEVLKAFARARRLVRSVPRPWGPES
jgi:hypothetical protein